MNIDFQAFMVLGLLVSGIIWAADAWFFAPRREQSLAGGGKEPVLVDYARSFFPVILIVLLLRSFLVEPFRIPSGSMMPTLLNGDFILVNKFTYGLRLPVLGTELVEINEPARGDVVVFRYPGDPSVDYIKRVIGLPGDRVDIRLTAGAGRADKEAVTRTLLQNVEVLGVDQISSDEKGEPQIVDAVTLLVTPVEGKKLTLAQTVGSLNLMLRNEGDVSVARDNVITLSSLRTYVPRPVVKPGKKVVKRSPRPRSSGSTVRIIRGMRSKTEKVKNGTAPVKSAK